MSVVYHGLVTQRSFLIDSDEHVNISIDPGVINYAISAIKHGPDEIRVLSMRKFNLKTHPWTEPDEDHPTVFVNLTHSLREFLLPLADQIKYVIIEKQLKTNYVATRIMQHTIALCQSLLTDRQLAVAVVEFSPKLKSHMFGVKGLQYRELKNWATEKAEALLTERDDVSALETFQAIRRQKKKPDDEADTIVQEAAHELYLVKGGPKKRAAKGAPKKRFG